MGNHEYHLTNEQLLDYFDKYKDEVKNNPILVHDFVGKDGMSAHREKERPLTIEGFCNWMWRKGYKGVEKYIYNNNKSHDQFIETAAYIRSQVREDQITGGMVGIFNHSLTARLQGLTDKSEVTKVVEQPLFPDKSMD